MPQTPALLQAVLNDPDNDALRLHLADYWAQTPSGEASRVELIRAQIALEFVANEDRAWLELIRRERELLQANQATWERPLRNAIRPSIRNPGQWLRSQLFGTGGTWGFRRGFIEQVLASASGFLQEDIQLFELTPLREVLLTNASTMIPELVNEPRLDRLKSLHLVSDAEFDEDMALLMDSARHQGLEVLEVRIPRVDTDLTGLFALLSHSPKDDDPQLFEYRIWKLASEERRQRLRLLANKPRFVQRLNEPLATTEVELLQMSAWVWFGEGVRKSQLWAMVKTFHDLEDDEGLCRHAVLGKPGRFDAQQFAVG